MGVGQASTRRPRALKALAWLAAGAALAAGTFAVIQASKPDERAPRTVMALGHTYELERTKSTDDTELTISLGSGSNYWTLLWWESDDPDAQVTVTTDEGVIWTSPPPGTDEATPDQVLMEDVQHRGNAMATVTSSSPGLLVGHYVLDEFGPVDGVNEGGFGFHQQVGHERLLGAVVSEPGEAEVSLTIPAKKLKDAGRHLTLRAACSGFGDGNLTSWAPIDPYAGSSGSDDCTYPVPGQFTGIPFEAPKGDLVAHAKHSPREVVVDLADPDAPPGSTGDGRVALAVYTAHTAPEGSTGLTYWTQRTEVWRGHTWKRVHRTSQLPRDGADGPSYLDLSTLTDIGEGPWLMAAAHTRSNGKEHLGDEIPLNVTADGTPLKPGLKDIEKTVTTAAKTFVPAGTERLELSIDGDRSTDPVELSLWTLAP